MARRAILEEAAGIGGLHQRRHAAELRLRGAETNLSRLDDLIREIDGQLQNLKRQARQASRYKNLSGHILKAEALALHLRWTAAEKRLEGVRVELDTPVVEEVKVFYPSEMPDRPEPKEFSFMPSALKDIRSARREPGDVTIRISYFDGAHPSTTPAA